MLAIWDLSKPCTPTDHTNIALCHKLIKLVVDDDFFMGLLYIGAAEDRESVSAIKEYLTEVSFLLLIHPIDSYSYISICIILVGQARKD
jgi:hypothetical protein